MTAGGGGTLQLGATTVNNAGTLQVAPVSGNVLTISGLTLNSGSTLGMTFGSSTIDLNNMVLTLASGTETISLAGTVSAPGNYTLIADASGISSAGATLALNTTNLAGGFTYSILSTSSLIQLHVTSGVIPTGLLTWNPSGSGGTWDTTTQNWLDNSMAVAFQNTNTVTFTDTGAGIVNISNGGVAVQPTAVTVTNSGLNTYTFTGDPIGGSASLTKFGTGLLVIANVNSFTGPTNVSTGSLTITGSGSLANTSGVTVSGTFNLTTSGNALGSAVGVTVTTGGLLNVSTSQTIASLTGTGGTTSVASGAIMTLGGGSYTGAVNGAGSVTIAAGSGQTVTFGGSNVYTGGTTVNSGTLQVLAASSLSASSNLTVGASGMAVLANAGQALGTLNNSGTTSFVAVSGAISLASLTGGGTTNFSSDANIPSITGGTVSVSGNLTASTGISGGNVTVVGGTASISAFSGSSTALSLGGSTAAIGTLNGSGAITLSGTNLSVSGGGSYGGSLNNGVSAGKLTVTGGTLTLSGADGLTGGISINNATLAVASQAALGNNAISFSGGTLHVTGNIDDTGHAFNFTNGGTINIDANETLSLTGSQITGNITQTGSGTLIIVGAFSGTTAVGAGSTYQANPGSTGNVTLANGSVLDFTSAGQYSGNVTLSSSSTAVIENTSGGVVTLSGTIDKTHANLALSGPGNFWVNGTITGGTVGVDFNSDMLFNGGGTTTFSTQQSWVGPTTISAGSTVFASGVNNALPTSTILNLGDGSNTTGSYNLGGNSQTLAGIVAWGSGTSNSITSSAAGGQLFVNVAAASFSGGVDSYSGLLTGSMGLHKEGAGTLELTGTSNTYTGSTTIDAGTLQLGANGALPTTTTLSLASGGTFDMNGHTQQIASLESASSTATVTGSAGSVLDVSHSAAISSIYAGIVSGQVSLAFNGVALSAEVLSGAANNYSGSTTINSAR